MRSDVEEYLELALYHAYPIHHNMIAICSTPGSGMISIWHKTFS